MKKNCEKCKNKAAKRYFYKNANWIQSNMLRGLLILESNPKTLFLFGVGKLGKLTCLSFPNDKQTVKDNSEYINPFRQMPNLMAMLSLSKSPFFLFWTGKSELQQALGHRLQKIK